MTDKPLAPPGTEIFSVLAGLNLIIDQQKFLFKWALELEKEAGYRLDTLKTCVSNTIHFAENATNVLTQFQQLNREPIKCKAHRCYYYAFPQTGLCFQHGGMPKTKDEGENET